MNTSRGMLWLGLGTAIAAFPALACDGDGPAANDVRGYNGAWLITRLMWHPTTLTAR